MLIRPERPNEHDAIRGLVEEAFRTAKHADGDEHFYVDRLRAAPGYLPELALVAEEGGQLVGHVMLTRLGLRTDRGPFEALLLSPLSVRLDARRKGLGARLVRDDLERARAAGFRAVVLVGDPAYYGRFGFRAASEHGITNTDGIEAWAVQALELAPGALEGARGTVSFPK